MTSKHLRESFSTSPRKARPTPELYPPSVIGAHFVAPFGDEATLFRLAAQLEQARPWADRRPPVSATAVSA